MKRCFLLIIVIICSFKAANSQGFSKIEQELYQLIVQEDDDLFDINIVLKEQYQEDRATFDFSDKTTRRKFIIGRMKQFSETSQSDIIAHLQLASKSSRAMDIKSYWIANMIHCKADGETIMEIAAHPDVLSVGLNKLQKLLPDMKMGKDISGSKEIAYNVSKVNADAVWELGYTGENVVVAVLDTGVNYDHEDLRDNMWESNDYPFYGYDFINNDNDPKDDHGHGSHCAGTVAGTGAAGCQTGMAPGAKIMAIKVLNGGGSGTLENALDGIQFAAENGADILSMSFGFKGGGGATERIPLRTAMVNLLEIGVIASVAAGNEGDQQGMYPIPNNVGLPGNCPPPWLHPDQTLEGGLSAVVCVGATDINDDIAYFSGEGPVTWSHIAEFEDYPYNPEMGLIRPDVCAPGVNVKSLTHNNNSNYVSYDGTSMATPCVAGVMALLLSKNPDLTPAEICELLETTAVPLSEMKSNLYGSGRIDALAAIDAVSSGLIQLEAFEIDDSEGNNDQKMNPGEKIKLSVTLKNSSEENINAANLLLHTSNNWVTFDNNTSSFSNLAPGESATIDDAFSFTLSENAIPKRNIYFSLKIDDGLQTATVSFKLVVYDYRLEYGFIAIDDSNENQNNMLDPGETAEMIVHILNTGNEISRIATGEFVTTASSFLTIYNHEISSMTMDPDETAALTFNVKLNEEATIDDLNIPLALFFTDEAGKRTELQFYYEYPCFIPINLKVESISSRAARVSWEANDKDVSYNIYRNGELLQGNYPKTSYTDYGLESGTEYCYVVAAVCVDDFESERTEEACAGGVDIHRLSNNVKIYPNPVHHSIYIEGENLKTVALYNILGEKMEETECRSAQTKIDLSELAAGIYIMEITDRNGAKMNEKVIVRR